MTNGGNTIARYANVERQIWVRRMLSKSKNEGNSYDNIVASYVNGESGTL